MYAGLSALGLTISAIALVAAPLTALWAFLGVKLGRRQEERARGSGTGAAPAPTPTVG
jgi:AAA family ATP:ADP antiporter